MRSVLKFKRNYFALTIIILAVEILIALFMHDKIIRPYVGDFLVVILVYCFLRSFFDLPVITLAISSLIFSFLVETLQYLNILQTLGLQDSGLARTLMGSSFEWTDLAAYTLGIAFVLYMEKLTARKV